MPTGTTNSTQLQDLHDAPRAARSDRDEKLLEPSSNEHELVSPKVDDLYDNVACTD